MLIRKIAKFKESLLDELFNGTCHDVNDGSDRFENLKKKGPDLIKSANVIGDDEEDPFTEYDYDGEKIEKLDEESIISFFRSFVEYFEDYYYFSICKSKDEYIIIGAHTYEYSQYVKECDKYED